MEIHMDFMMTTLKPFLCGWLYEAWNHVSNELETILILRIENKQSYFMPLEGIFKKKL